MNRCLKIAVIVAVTTGFLNTGVGAGFAQETAVSQETTEKVSAIINTTVEKVKGYLQDPDYKKPEKRVALRHKVRQVLLDVSDMRRISLLTLGMNRRKFDDQQFEAFIDVFSQLLFSTYITHLERSPDQGLEIRKYVRLSATRCQVQAITTKVRPTDKEIPIYFNFYEKEGEFKVDDLTIEGVSMVLNYRSQFNELLARMNPVEFLDHLRQRAEELDEVEESDDNENPSESE